jgi:hypothetical protein
MMQGDTIDQAAIPDASVTPSKIAGSGDFAFPADVRLKDGDGSNYVGFQAPTTVSTNKIWTLPAADGSANQYLKTDGSGTLSWGSDASGIPASGGTFTGAVIFENDVTLDGSTAGRDIVFDRSDNALEFAANAKAIFGSGLEVYNDATNNQIKSTSGKVIITTTAGNSDIEVTPNGSGNVKLDGLAWPNADGSADQYLKTNGSGALSWAAAGGGITGMVVLTSGSSASWSIPAGVTTIKVICTGGGGGATGPTNPPGDEASGAAGGGGGTSIKYYDVSGGGTATYTIGAGGTGHTNTGSAGNGGDSTFAYGGTTITGGGGVGGTASGGVGGTGGTASGGTMNLPGCGGEGGIQVSLGQAVVNAQGGTSYWGAGVGRGRRQGSGASGDTGVDGAANTGAGGTAATHNDRTGGAGGTGVIVIEY